MAKVEASYANELPAVSGTGGSVPLSANSPQLLAAIRQLQHAGELHSRRLIRASGLTVPQIVVLRAIDEFDRPTVGGISRAVSLSTPTVTTILNRLEERGLVARDRGAVDRRQILLSLTPRGRDVLATAPALLPEVFVRRFEALATWEQNMLISSLQRLVAMMGPLPEEAVPDADGLRAAERV